MKKIIISKRLQKFFLSLPSENLESINTMRFDEDIVIADGYVPHHTDGTELGKDTIMLVITNEGYYNFNYDGKLYNLPVGRIFRFDGNKKHAIITFGSKLNAADTNISHGRLTVLLWDVPVEVSSKTLIPQIEKRIKELYIKYIKNLDKHETP